MTAAVAESTSIFLVVSYETYLGPTYTENVVDEETGATVQERYIRSNRPHSIDSFGSEAEARTEFKKVPSSGYRAYLIQMDVEAEASEAAQAAFDFIQECADEVEESESYGQKNWSDLFMDDEDGREWYEALVLEDTGSKQAV